MNFDDKAATWDDNPERAERADAVAAAIRRQVRMRPEMTGFEYGCGTGLLSFALAPHLRRITLADSSPGMLAVLQERIAARGVEHMTPIQLDLMTDPLPDTRFSLVYTMMAMHHVADTDKALSAFFALLDSGGYLCLADLDPEDGSFHGPEFEGHLGFDREKLADKARMAGFTALGFTTVYHITKGEGDAARTYPVFLMTAQKP